MAEKSHWKEKNVNERHVKRAINGHIKRNELKNFVKHKCVIDGIRIFRAKEI